MSEVEEPVEEEEEGSPGWMATFADLVTLLLVFFVLLFSMSTIEVIKAKAVFGSLRDAFGGSKNPTEDFSGSMVSKEKDNTSLSVLELSRIRQEILKTQENTFNAVRSYLSKKAVEGSVSAVLDEGTITLTIGDGLLFNPGEETLSEQAFTHLEPLLEIIRSNREMMVSIKGYTDNDEVPEGARFKDNWELSALRAVNVLRWFIENDINPLRITATGMGDLNPLFPNDTPENQAKNRRVEFSLERTIHAPKK